jgi:hypothetical protein
MKRGEIYRTSEAIPERGNKPGFYVVESRSFMADNGDVSSVISAPVFPAAKVRELNQSLRHALELDA